MGSNLKSDISNRILETRKQTEELKAQLQNLIDSGINSSLEYNRASDNSHFNEDKTRQESQNKVQIIKSYDTKHSQHVDKPSTSRTEQSTKLCKEDEPAKQESPKKVRSYNVVEAREYIKKQREKRLEQLKAQNADKIKADLKKKKLEELRKRSQELVTKNIQAKRERSKSRDRVNRNDIRFDKEKRNPNYLINEQKKKDSKYQREEQLDKVNVQAKRERSKSRNRVNRDILKNSVEERNPNLLYPPSPEFIVKERRGRSDKVENKQHIQKTNDNKFNQIEKPEIVTYEQKRKDDSEQKKEQLGKENSNKDFPTVDSNIKIIAGNSSERNGAKSEHNIFDNTLKPINLFGMQHSKNEQILQTNNEFLPVRNILEYKRSSENASLRSPSDQNLVNVTLRSPSGQNLVTPKNYKLKSTLSEVGIGTDNLEKYTKETQTAQEKIEFPSWLQENQPPGDPFNFINTVKRKLEDVVKLSKPSVEVGVQSSLIQENSNTKTPANTKSKKEIMEMLQQSTKSTKKTELNSFISHRCVNLNSKIIDHLELIPKDSKAVGAGLTYSSKFTETESESDTSKNIPEISSESGTSLKDRVESVKDNGFDMEKINKMKLVPHDVKSNTTTIQSEIEQPSSERKSKKSSQKHTNLLSSNLSKSRESIISYNSPNYDTQRHSTSKTHKTTDLSNAKSSLFDQRSSNIPEKNSVRTTYSVDVLSPNYDTQMHSSSKTRKTTELTNVKSLLFLDKHSSDIPEINANNLPTTHSMNALTSSYDTQLKSSSKSPKTIDLKTTLFSDKLSSNVSEKNTKSSVQATASANVSNKSRQSVISVHSPTNSKPASHSSDVKSDVQTILTISEKPSVSDVHSRRKESDIPSSSNKKTEVSQKTSKISSEKYTSLFSDGYSRSDSSMQYINTSRGSGSFSDDKLTSALPLKEPSLKLVVSKKGSENEARKQIKNVSVRSNKAGFQGDMNKANEIHLKFEAEIHLLNDFNESLRKFSAAEKTMESMKLNDEVPPPSKILEQRDVQTFAKPLSESKTVENDVPDTAKSEISTINYSRGSMLNDLSGINIDNSSSKLDTSLSVSNLDKSSSSAPKSNIDLSNFENLQTNNYAGMSLRMFEHLIKDEDARLENLKTILKIRERALLDRTKGELAWLEIQRKHLRETGQIHEASLIKKKQRGILMNHQKEKHEMQRLKQMQKAASIERKTILKEQRNLIKHQLSTDNMLSKIKVNAPRERRLSGPLKVIQSHTESIRSETSISRKSSSEREQEVFSVTSHTHSIVSRVSEVSENDIPLKNLQPDVESLDFTKKLDSEASWAPLSQMKMTLLLREAALQKRRKAAEELLQWHKKLLEEEKRITELELTASAIISQIPNSVLTPPDVPEKYKFKGKQLNQLWYNLTGSRENKFAEEKIYPMSQIALDRFCKNAREYSSKSKKILRKLSNSEISESNDGASENIPEQRDNLSVRTEQSKNKEVPSVTANDYTSDFDVESIQEIVHNDGMDVVDQSINELIDNFSKIKDDISSLSIKQSLISSEVEEQKESRSDRTVSDASVVETEQQKSQFKEKSSKQDMLKSSVKESSTEISDEISPEDTSTLDEQQSVIRSKTEEILSQLEDKLNIPSKISYSTEENTGKTEHILENSSQLEDKVNTELSSAKSLVEDNQISRHVNNSISKTEEILERLSQLEEKSNKISSRIEENELSKDKNSRTDVNDVESALDESQISNATKDSLNKSEEILLRLSEIETGVDISSMTSPKEDASIQKASDSVISLQADLSKSEEILSKLSTKPSASEEVKKSEDTCEPSKLSHTEESTEHPSSQKSVVEEETETSAASKVENASSEKMSSRKSLSEEQSVIEALENEDSSSRSSPEEEIVVANLKLQQTEGEEENSISEQAGTEDLKPEEPSHDKASEEEVKASEPSENASMTESVQETITSADFVEEESKIEETSKVQSSLEVADINDKGISVENEEVTSKNLPIEKEFGKDTEDEPVKLEDKNLESTDDTLEVKTIKDEAASSETSKTKSEQTDSEDKTSNKVEDMKTATEETHSSTKEDETALSKEDINSFEEKEQDSLSSSTVSSSHSVTAIETVSEKSKGSISDEKSPKSGTVDVKKRVSEILADANHSPRGDRSPRLQDLYVTTYDLVSPANSPELGSPVEEQRIVTAKSIFGTEAEEILRKQLAIEQEIKQITEQQQKEQQLPYMFVREIPNKPPPPYTPPSSLPPGQAMLVPTADDIEEITKYSAKILHKAYLSNNLDNVSISENTLGLISKNISTDCYKFGFDLCKEIAKRHYKQFEREKCPTWLQVSKNAQLAIIKPLDVGGLEKYTSKKLKELFGYKKIDRRENAIIKWSRKKRDHVDEILVMESQAEESQWTNYDKDELLVIDEVTNEIMNTLLKESGEIFSEILSKRTYLY